MEIILIRHGLSEGNKNKAIHKELADHVIPLSDEGRVQAEQAGLKLQNFLRKRTTRPNYRLWCSPYLRTRETAEGILPMTWEDGKLICNDYREDVALCEQNFGLFDGLEDDELAKEFPKEFAHYQKMERFRGRFWSRYPGGESRSDVVQRIHQMFGTWQRDAVNNIIVVSHGVTIRAIVMRWLHLSPEWFERERNPKNCSIRIIQDHEDLGYI